MQFQDAATPMPYCLQVPPSVGDELLALAECRLEGMPPPSLHRLSSSAAALGLEADEAFTKAFHAAVSTQGSSFSFSM
jgi:hypothetical protein